MSENSPFVVRLGDKGSSVTSTELGEKGFRLVEMSRLDLPVPPGFVLTAQAGKAFLDAEGELPDAVHKELLQGIAHLEQVTGQRLGDPENPLLVSVRCGGVESTEGAVAPTLNIGLNDEVTVGLAQRYDEVFAYDSYRRLIQTLATVTMEMPPDILEQFVQRAREGEVEEKFSAETLKALVDLFKRRILDFKGEVFPQDVFEQLVRSVGASFGAYNSRLALNYRNAHGLAHEGGASVVVQAMVFGDLGDDCATGVAFTRDPSSGKRRFYGEWLRNAQGEEVLSGFALPQPLNEASGAFEGDEIFEEVMPDCYAELVTCYEHLEKTLKEFLVLEFTVEKGKLWLLQARVGKRGPQAEVQIAVDMAREGLISRAEALLKVHTTTLEKLLHPRIDPQANTTPVARGLGASPGAATGRAVFSSKDALEWAGKGLAVILILEQTSPDDVHGMAKSQGILTSRGGITSHAAVVARGMSRTCIVGCSELQINVENRFFTAGDVTVREGDEITLDGITGAVMLGQVATIQPDRSSDLTEFLSWIDEFTDTEVYVNADTARDCLVGREFGARGVGLCRTEHMFFNEGRIRTVREMILATDEAERRMALEKILPMQKGDFKEIFRVMAPLPVTIRLLDPPLHEFLPRGSEEIAFIAEDLGMTPEEVQAQAMRLSEVNPMLGHRGCRVGLTYPEIYEMQVRAIFEAACELKAEEDLDVRPEIMLPLIGHVGEFILLREVVQSAADRVMRSHAKEIAYTVGTMIELPRACMTADEIASVADFFSVGTNDLTQTVFGVSRDDCGRFLPFYVDMGILPVDPFVSIDPAVGALVEMTVQKGRAVKPELKIGICGEHAGEAQSVHFFHRAGLDYVSCSPFRVPIARLAAAHASLEGKI
jgi:pyruvate, orthophosphate dikinase